MPVVTSTIGHTCPCSQGEHLKNQKRKFLVPVAVAVAAALSMGAGAVSAKSNNATPRAAKKCTVPLDAALDAKEGKNAGWLAQRWACGDKAPLKAEGDPITIGFQNPEGPVINFPEYRLSAEAAVNYINTELGGVGADPATGKAGRPLKLEVCKYNALVPAELPGCANTLAAKNPLLVIASLAFGDSHFAIYQAKGIPIIVGTPIFPKDFTSPATFAIGGGGGCLGVHLGLMTFATQYLMKDTLKKPKGGRIGIPWAKSAPGIFCYNDLEAKPLDVLAGKTLSGAPITSTAKLKGTMPNTTYLGVPVITGKADVSAEVAQILNFKPDVMVYSNQGSECWTWMNEMIKQGWTPKSFPVVLSGACIDLKTMTALGNAIKGIYTIGGLSILDPDALTGFHKQMALNYQRKMATYMSDQKLTGTGFATQGYGVVLNTWMMMDLAGGAKATGKDVIKAFKQTKNHVGFGSTGISCKDAIKPYIAVCSTDVSASQWTGTKLKAVKDAQDFSGLVLVGKGDELRLSEVK